MFGKKYTFETRQTKTKRVFRRSFIGLGFLLAAFTLLCLYIPNFAQSQNEIAEQAFFERAPDVIAVFTGDSGRIDYTLKKAEKYPSSQVFITGVYAKNSLKTLLLEQRKGLSVDQFLEQESHHIELDYLARNTIENVLATLHYLKKIEGGKNVLIISSDYHMLRISEILGTLKDTNSKHRFYFESIPSDYTKMSNLKKLFKEIYKLIKASAFLMLWDGENQFN